MKIKIIRITFFVVIALIGQVKIASADCITIAGIMTCIPDTVVTNFDDLDVNINSTGSNQNDIVNNGVRIASGISPRGLEVIFSGSNADVSIGNNDKIIFDGDNGEGISVDDTSSDSILIIDNQSTILGTGESLAGIRITSSSLTDMRVINGGTIDLTSTGPDTGDADGIEIDSTGLNSAVYVNNTGTIIIDGNGYDGIFLHQESGEAEIDNNGLIDISGDAVRGIVLTQLDGDGEIINFGNITLEGENNIGISLFQKNGLATVENKGTITLNGTSTSIPPYFGIGHAIGIFAWSDSSQTLEIENSGSIIASPGDPETFFENAVGITAYNFDSNIETLNTGVIKIPNGVGILTGGSSVTTSTVINEGEIDAGDIGAGVVFIGGVDNHLINRGAIISKEGSAVGVIQDGDITQANLFTEDDETDEITLNGQSAKITIDNYGTLIGNVTVGHGSNVLNNHIGAQLESGNLLYLGDGNLLTNDGNISPGGLNKIQRTNLVGNYIQSSTGSLTIDIDDRKTESSDVIQISGTAILRGTIIPNIINLDKLSTEFVALTADGGIQDSGVMAQDTIGYDFSVAVGNNNTYLILQAEKIGSIGDIITNAPQVQKSQNLNEIANALSLLENSGSAEGAKLINSLRLLPSSKEAAKAVERLIPKSQEKVAGNAVSNNVSFSNAMLSCKQHEGPSKFTKEGQCYWGKVTGRKLDKEATTEQSGVKEDAFSLTTGLQYALQDELRFGFAFGFEDNNSKSFSQSQALGTSEGKSYRGGIVIKNQWGPINAYFNLMGNYAKLDHKRIVNLTGLGNLASAKQDISSGLGRIRLSYLFDKGPWYVKPIVDIDATYLHLGSYKETGTGAANLRVASSDEWLFGSTLSLEVGGELKLNNGSLIRPYLRGGIRFISEDDMNTTVNFAGAPAGLAPFQVNSKLEDVFGEVEAGLHVLSSQGINLHMVYEGRFAKDSEQHSGSLKAGINF